MSAGRAAFRFDEVDLGRWRAEAKRRGVSLTAMISDVMNRECVSPGESIAAVRAAAPVLPLPARPEREFRPDFKKAAPKKESRFRR